MRLLLFAATLLAASQDTPPSLDPSTPLSRPIQTGETHTYTLPCSRDQFVSLRLRQRGVNLWLAIHDERGAPLAGNRMTANNGVKEVFWVAPQTAPCRVAVTALDTRPAQGEYILELQAPRPASPADRARAAAFAAMSEGSALMERRPRTGANLRAASEKFREARRLWNAVQDPSWESYAAHELGATLLNLDQLPDAREALLSALALRRAPSTDPYHLALTLNTLGAVYNNLGDYRQALPMFEEALPIRRSLGDRIGEANTLNNIGFAYNRLGDTDSGIQKYEQALAIRREIGDKPGLGIALGNLAALHRTRGQFDKALALATELLALARDLRDDSLQGDALVSLASTYYSSGDTAQAVAYWKEAEAPYERAGDAFGLASTWNGLGAAHVTLRKNPEAAQYYARSLEMRRKAANAIGQVSSLLGMCFSHSRAGDPAKAIVAAEEALAIATRISARQSIGRSHRCLGEADLQAGRLDSAAGHFQQASTIFRSNGDLDDLSLTLAQLAATDAAAGRTNDALTHVRESLRLGESERSGLPADLKALLRGARADEYSLEISLLMRLQADAQAFEASERSRARSLIESLPESRLDLHRRMTPEQRAREEALQTRISSLQRELFRENLPPARQRDIEQQLSAAERDLQLHQLDLRRAHLRPAEMEYAEALSLARIRAELLDNRTTLIEYALGEKRSFVWAVTAKGLISAELPGRAAIETQVAAFRKELSERVSALTANAALARVQTQSRELYKTLLAPVEKALEGSDRLILVPDGALSYLPFEALTGTAFLLEKFSIGYAPSASALAALQRRAPNTASRALLAVADPLYDSSSALVRLPNSRAEVTSITALFPQAETRTFTGADATESRLKSEDLAAYRYLHFATHGYFDEEHPARGGLALTPSAQPGEDGVLQIREILGLRLNADLVTLSACQTGLGRIVAGEGVLGLTRAFFLAGAQSLVVSLWNVNDTATAQLMKEFYANLQKGKPRAEALRSAKLSLLRGTQPAWRHPYYWAPFIFIGDERPRPGRVTLRAE